MEIKSKLTNRKGQTLDLIYRDVDSLAELGDRKVSGVHAYCFCGDKLVVVFSAAKGYWTPPGGGVESGESIEDAVTREVKEETNMRVLAQQLIGYQDIFESAGIVTQTRSVCVVEPVAPFENDPDGGEITEIKLIDPKDYRKYFDWSEVGDHLIERALEIKKQIS